jgi:hypothetical protein
MGCIEFMAVGRSQLEAEEAASRLVVLAVDAAGQQQSSSLFEETPSRVLMTNQALRNQFKAMTELEVIPYSFREKTFIPTLCKAFKFDPGVHHKTLRFYSGIEEEGIESYKVKDKHLFAALSEIKGAEGRMFIAGYVVKPIDKAHSPDEKGYIIGITIILTILLLHILTSIDTYRFYSCQNVRRYAL